MEKIVVATGVFDILHLGHIGFLKQAKKLGSKLIVIVARDTTVEKLKGKKPLNNEKYRLKMVSNLKMVDKAVLGENYFKDKTSVLKKLNPDIIVLGYNQKISKQFLEKELIEKGFKSKIVRAKKYGGYSTKKIFLKAKNSLT